jgi:hypothetical protein
MSLHFLTRKIVLPPEEHARRQRLWDEAVRRRRPLVPTVFSIRQPGGFRTLKSVWRTHRRTEYGETPSNPASQT